MSHAAASTAGSLPPVIPSIWPRRTAATPRPLPGASPRRRWSWTKAGNGGGRPRSGDDARTCLALQAESLGYPTAWLGFGRAPVSDLALAERILDATSTITVATAIVNMWTNDAADVAASYRQIAARHGDRFLLGIGIGHPESVTAYRLLSPSDSCQTRPSAGPNALAALQQVDHPGRVGAFAAHGRLLVPAARCAVDWQAGRRREQLA